jgi:N-acetylneuraminate synthase
MPKTMKIGDKVIGRGNPCYVIAEIGINHSGDMKLAKKLIDAAIFSGCDAVKFQKRTIDIVYTEKELAAPRKSPLGETNGDLKRGLEFGLEEYKEIDRYCKEKGIQWFVSCWDEPSVDFIEENFDVVCYKIASASLTDDNLLKHTKATGKPIILSTGMSTMDEIRHAVEILGEENTAIMHCTSTYPSKPEELNLNVINTFSDIFDCPIGYSGHETGLQTTVAAVVLGACMVERHITLDRAMWGSDQAASVEPHGLWRMTKDIRAIEKALGDGNKIVVDSEVPIIEKLRRVK